MQRMQRLFLSKKNNNSRNMLSQLPLLDIAARDGQHASYIIRILNDKFMVYREKCDVQ